MTRGRERDLKKRKRENKKCSFNFKCDFTRRIEKRRPGQWRWWRRWWWRWRWWRRRRGGGGGGKIGEDSRGWDFTAEGGD